MEWLVGAAISDDRELSVADEREVVQDRPAHAPVARGAHVVGQPLEVARGLVSLGIDAAHEVRRHVAQRHLHEVGAFRAAALDEIARKFEVARFAREGVDAHERFQERGGFDVVRTPPEVAHVGLRGRTDLREDRVGLAAKRGKDGRVSVDLRVVFEEA